MPVRIVVIGSLNMDMTVYTPRHPQIGETILGDSLFINPGGKGGNQAVAAARLGAAVHMVGKTGKDSFGEQLRANLKTNGVDTEWILCDTECATGTALITVDARGANSIIVIPGSNMRLSPSDIDRAKGLISQCQLIIMQLEIPLETVLRAAQIAHKQGVKVILNPSPAKSLSQEMLELVDILVINETELALLTQSRVDAKQSLLNAARRLKRMTPADVVLTLGNRGSWWLGDMEFQKLPAFSVQAIDTIAAGDAFIGGLAVALLENQPMVEALRWGNAAGALATTRKGAQSSLPERNCVVELLNKHFKKG